MPVTRERRKGSLRVPYAQAVHSEAELRAVLAVLRKHQTILGRKTQLFEQRVAALFGKQHGVMVNSGSSANLLALEVANLPAGSEVVTPVLTFSTTLSPILQKGLVPVFVDVTPGYYVVDVEQIEAAITRKTRALMIPLLLGNLPDLAGLRAIAARHRLMLIEDSCDTLGATLKGKPTGAYTHVTTTSFYGSHIITAAGGGGMVCVNEAEQDRTLRILRGWGRSSAVTESEDVAWRYRRRLDGVPYDAKFIFERIGYNFLPLEISAAFALVQLRKLSRFAKTRRRNFDALLRFFRKYEEFFELPLERPGAVTQWLAFPLTIRTTAPFSRFDLASHLEGANIQTRPIFTGNVLRHPAFAPLRRRVQPQRFAAADTIMRNGLLVGCHHGLTSHHLGYMKETLADFLAQY